MRGFRRRLKDAEDRINHRGGSEDTDRAARARFTERELGALLRAEAKLGALGPNPRPKDLVAAMTEEEAGAWLRYWEAREEADPVGASHAGAYREAMLRNPEQYERWLEAGEKASHLEAEHDAPASRREETKVARRLLDAEELVLLNGYYPGQCCEGCGWGHPEADPRKPCERCGDPVSYYGYYHLRVEDLRRLRANVEAIDPGRYPAYHAKMRSHLERRLALESEAP